MHVNEGEEVMNHDNDADVGMSNHLDLNVDCPSPKLSNVNGVCSRRSLKHDVLKLGTEFDSDEQTYRFYHMYAELVGFSVRKDWVNRSKVHGRAMSRKFTCSRQGHRKKDKRDVNVKKHRKETGTGCLTYMVVTRHIDGKYLVTQFEAEHNHEDVNLTEAERLLESSAVLIPSSGLFILLLKRSGKKPKFILSDQDATVVQTIHAVLPETSHCTCAWQMYLIALKHLRHVVKEYDSFVIDLRSCIFGHDQEEDFIQAWESVLVRHGLCNNAWLRWMYREKEKWAVAYGRNTLFVDRNGTLLVELLSYKLRSCLSPDIDVLQFFKHFENVVNEQRYRELESTLDMGSHAPVLMGNAILLKHPSETYTPKAFEVFQREYEKCLNVIIDKCGDRDTRTDYKAKTYGKSMVAYNSFDGTVSCNCMKFEHVGVAESDPALEYASRQLDEVMRGIERILNFRTFEEAKGTTEAESIVPDKDQPNHCGEQIPGVSCNLNIRPSPPGTVLFVACAPPTYISSPCPAPSPSPLTQDSLIHSQFQDPMSNGNQLKQVMDIQSCWCLGYKLGKFSMVLPEKDKLSGFNVLLYTESRERKCLIEELSLALLVLAVTKGGLSVYDQGTDLILINLSDGVSRGPCWLIMKEMERFG
ncbi:hypothetical protein SASPL_107573 [Salvia splendens]|uniref:Protein FAR1-RELATED SEQUENCE n=1 Tax=Salvia splendens TaxID=180675 RepID=A0A8X9A6L8_SALSN|nr:hypothetical protein SASPL_107573 [Salvia splendens]